MRAIGSYVLTLVCGAVICSVLLSMEGCTGLRKLVCGLFMVFLLIAPLKEIDFGDLEQDFREYSDHAREAAACGVSQAEGMILDIIKQECESYILDKAAELQCSAQAQVEVDPESRLPVAVGMSGDVTPYQKQVLSDYISRELGIGKEAQHWN